MNNREMLELAAKAAGYKVDADMQAERGQADLAWLWVAVEAVIDFEPGH